MTINEIFETLRHTKWYNSDNRPRVRFPHSILDESNITSIIFFDDPKPSSRQLEITKGLFGKIILEYNSGNTRIEIGISGIDNIDYVVQRIVEFAELLMG